MPPVPFRHPTMIVPRFPIMVAFIPSRCLVFLAAMLSVFLHTPLHAAQWTFQPQVSQSVEIDDNITLNEDSDGTTIGSVTELDLDVVAETPQSNFLIRPGVTINRYEGSSDSEELNGAFPRLSIQATRRRGDIAGNLEAQGSVQPTGESQVEDTGETDTDAKEFRGQLQVEIERQLNIRESVAIRGGAAARRFSGGGSDFVESNNYNLGAGWTRAVNSRTETGIDVGLGLFEADDDTNRRTFSAGTTGRLTYRVNSRLGISGQAGPVFVATNADEVADDGGKNSNNDYAVGFIGGANADYAFGPNVLTLTASQSLTPSAFGDLRYQTRVGLDYLRELNERSGVRAGAGYTRSEPVFNDSEEEEDTRNFFSIGTSYFVSLTEAWSAELGYTFRALDRGDGTATSNGVLFTIKWVPQFTRPQSEFR